MATGRCETCSPPVLSVADGGVQSRILEDAARRPHTALREGVRGERWQIGKENQQ